MIDVFTRFVLPNQSLSSKLKQSFFSWKAISDFLSVAQSSSPRQSIQSFLLLLFGSTQNALYPATSKLTFSTHLPSMLFRVAAALNPFKNAFDEELFLALIHTHPEVLPLLFAPAVASAKVSDAILLDVRQSKPLIHWMLEPRASTAWERTVDFLCEILELPAVLPEDARQLSATNKPEFLEMMKSWVFPVALNRSVTNIR